MGKVPSLLTLLTLGLWVLTHVDWITSSVVGCIPQKMASFYTHWEVPNMRVASLHTHNDNFSYWLILSQNCATLPTGRSLAPGLPTSPLGPHFHVHVVCSSLGGRCSLQPPIPVSWGNPTESSRCSHGPLGWGNGSTVSSPHLYVGNQVPLQMPGH